MDTVEKAKKKPYTPPELIEYGSLIEITGNLGNDNLDPAQTGTRFTN